MEHGTWNVKQGVILNTYCPYTLDAQEHHYVLHVSYAFAFASLAPRSRLSSSIPLLLVYAIKIDTSISNSNSKIHSIRGFRSYFMHHQIESFAIFIIFFFILVSLSILVSNVAMKWHPLCHFKITNFSSGFEKERKKQKRAKRSPAIPQTRDVLVSWYLTVAEKIKKKLHSDSWILESWLFWCWCRCRWGSMDSQTTDVHPKKNPETFIHKSHNFHLCLILEKMDWEGTFHLCKCCCASKLRE